MKQMIVLLICYSLYSCLDRGKQAINNNIIGNWQLVEMKPPNDTLEYRYQELFIDNETVNTIMNVGLAKVRHYEFLGLDSLLVDGKASSVKLYITNDTLTFQINPNVYSKYIRIHNAITPEDYILKRENEKYWQYFYKRESIYLNGNDSD